MYEATSVDDDNNISGELLKVSNIKSREQVKKPKRIIFLASVYSILMLSLVVALFIKLSKPKKTLMKDPEETYADVGETRLLLERGEMEENESVEIEETLPEDEDFENSSKLIFERLKEASIKKEEEKVKKKIENNKKKNEESIEKEIEETTEEEVIEETTEERIEETTKKNAKNQDTKKVIDKEKVTEEETTLAGPIYNFNFCNFYDNVFFLIERMTMTVESLEQKIAKQEERLKQLKAQKQAVLAREKKKLKDQQRKEKQCGISQETDEYYCLHNQDAKLQFFLQYGFFFVSLKVQ